MLDLHHISAYCVLLTGLLVLITVPIDRWHPAKSGLVVLVGILLLAFVVGRML